MLLQPKEYWISSKEDEKKLWRYMDFAKFISLIESKSLHFINIGSLKASDKFEGKIPEGVIKLVQLPVENMTNEELIEQGFPKERIEEFRLWHQIHKAKLENERITKNLSLINSWHCNEIESYTMWKTYSSDKDGVAICTTTYKLELELKKNKDYTFVLDKVSYYNEGENEPIPQLPNVPWAEGFLKRRNFESENEYRAYLYMGVFGTKGMENVKSLEKVGKVDNIKVKVDLERMISAIYINPASQDWIRELVEDLMIRYELSIPVLKSSI